MDESLTGWLAMYGGLCFFCAIFYLYTICELQNQGKKWRWKWNWLILAITFFPGMIAVALFSIFALGLIKLWEALDIPVWREEDD
jgi:predicted permease